MPVQIPSLYRQAFYDPIVPALGVGAATGATGLAFGGIAGILQSSHPALFSITAGLQCFFLGSTYWYLRGAALLGSSYRPSRKQELAASGGAGALSGAAAGALRSRANVVPGAIMIGLFGLVGQYGYHAASDYSVRHEGQKPLTERLVGAKWSPFRALADAEYEEMLQEKMLRVEAEIALIDDEIAALKSRQIT